MTANGQLRALVALGVTVALWGSAFAAIRGSLRGLSPEALSLFRVAVASAALAALVGFRRPQRISRHDLARLVGVAFFGVFAYQLLLNRGEVELSAGAASVLVNTSPVFTALLAVSFFGERLGRLGSVGIVVAFAGAVLIALDRGGELTFRAGALIVLAAAVAQTLFFVLQKPLLERYRSFDVTCWAMWLGTLLLLPVCLPAFLAARPDRASLLAAVYLGLGPSAIGFVTWGYACARVDVSFAAAMLYLTPVFAFVPAWLLLGERPELAALLGGGVVTVGVAALGISRRRVGLATVRARRRGRAGRHR